MAKIGNVKFVAMFLLMIVLFSSCARSAIMTRESFACIEIGAPINEVVLDIGQPYNICKLASGKKEYEYIERLKLGNNTVTENHYYLTIIQGRVISKRMTRENMPGYDIIYRDNPTLTY